MLRENTDYGEWEQSLQQKVADVLRQVQSGEAVLTWSELHESISIIRAVSSAPISDGDAALPAAASTGPGVRMAETSKPAVVLQRQNVITITFGRPHVI
ncbi:MAG: hypothetical protein GPOALKHO_001154 [Sodalis sp.]|nr:MAG: hypothetical protein GPOALKHO_001154 [Sodalis sp.]